MIVLLLAICTVALVNAIDQTQLEKYGEKVKTYRLEVPGKEPITIIETEPAIRGIKRRWDTVSFKPEIDKVDVEVKNLMTHIIHDHDEKNNLRCYGPSCQEGFNPDEGPQKGLDEFTVEEKLNDYTDISKDRLKAISALAAKLKKEKYKVDPYSSMSSEEIDDEGGNGKVYTSWNRLKVKQHKHPYDDKDGWVTLEPVAWSTSKISKWKPNVKKQKPHHWNDDSDRYPVDENKHKPHYWNDDSDRYPTDENKHKPHHWNDDSDRYPSDDPYNSYQEIGNNYNYNSNQHKKPGIITRPGYINNKLHNLPTEYDAEMPSKPSWTKPQHQHQHTSYPLSWSPDDSRRPQKPNCDNEDASYPGDATVFYGISDSVVTDHRPSNFPYDYEALHQSSVQRPVRRPTQVVYAGAPELDSDRTVASRPPHGDGQWVLLSTTKGYRNKKRQRSLNTPADDHLEFAPITSHQAVSLTVLPVDNVHTNMTTSHGGLLEVEKSFKTVEESKRDMDKRYDLDASGSQHRPVVNKVVKKKIVSSVMPGPDSSTVLAAVGAGMVPATMAMVVPMMLGRRKRDVSATSIPDDRHNIANILIRHE